MTGLCCRHQVRHDDWLCCAHGVEHRGDVDDTLLGVARPPLEPTHATEILHRHEDGTQHAHAGDQGFTIGKQVVADRLGDEPHSHGQLEWGGSSGVHRPTSGDVVWSERLGSVSSSSGLADVGTIVLAAVVGAVLAGCLWLGYHAGDWPKVLAGLALGIAGAFVIVWVAGQERRSVDDHPAGHRPGTVRLDYTTTRRDEPKETR